MSRIFVTFHRDRWALDGSKDPSDETRKVTISEGRHEMERVHNPYGYQGNWLVLYGTMIGATEESFQEWVQKVGQSGRKIEPDMVIEIEEIPD